MHLYFTKCCVSFVPADSVILIFRQALLSASFILQCPKENSQDFKISQYQTTATQNLHQTTHSLSLTHTHTLSLSLSFTHTHTHTYTHTLSLSLSHTHTHTHTQFILHRLAEKIAVKSDNVCFALYIGRVSWQLGKSIPAQNEKETVCFL